MLIAADGRPSPLTIATPIEGEISIGGNARAPALMIQGAADMCDPPSESDGQERYFTGGYRRGMLDGVGHFPAREAPNEVASEAMSHLKQFA